MGLCGLVLLALVAAAAAVDYTKVKNLQWKRFAFPTGTRFKQITINEAGVWAKGTNNKNLFLEGTYQNPRNIAGKWREVDGEKLAHLESGHLLCFAITDAGDVTWRDKTGNNKKVKTGWFSSEVYPPYGKSWNKNGVNKKSGLKMKSITVTTKRWIWGVTTQGDVYYAKDKQSAWTRAKDSTEKMKSIHAGSMGLWALGEDGYPRYRTLSQQFPGQTGMGWQKVGDQKFTQLTAGAYIYGLTPDNKLLLRDGNRPDMGDDYVKGDRWMDATPKNTRVQQMEVWMERLMIVSTNGYLYSVSPKAELVTENGETYSVGRK